MQQTKAKVERREREGGLMATPQRIAELELSKQILENKAKSSEIALITIGRNAGENADRNVENDFNLAIDEINLIDDVATAFHAQGKK
jgi:beta-glucosidase